MEETGYCSFFRYSASRIYMYNSILFDSHKYPVLFAVPKLPIYSAAFMGTTGKLLVTGRRSFFYMYDTVSGKMDTVPRIRGREEKSWERSFVSPDGSTIALMGNDGYIVLMDAHSKSWIANVKINGSVRAVAFTADGQELLASGSDGDVYRWDMRTRKCLERFGNPDGTITSYIATTPSTCARHHWAVAAESGVVNMYTATPPQTRIPGMPMNTTRTPLKSLLNLHTSVDSMRFNHDGQLMAFASSREKDGLRVLHVPSATVFSNWPTSKTPLKQVSCLDFSPDSRYLAVGNDHGHCLLYRLLHYAK
jgi:U3 small nucleolar RNA-associated protein 18